MSERARLVDPPAVVSGALLALAVAVPTLVAGVLIDPDDQSNVVLLLYAAVMVGFALGGRRAGRRRPDAPFSNGALAALAAYGMIALTASIIRVVRGETPEAVPLVFNGFMAATFGIIGGLLAGWRGPSIGRGAPGGSPAAPPGKRPPPEHT